MAMLTTNRPSGDVTTSTGPASTLAAPAYCSHSGVIVASKPFTGGCDRSAGLASRRRARPNAALALKRAAPSQPSIAVAPASDSWRLAQRLGAINSVAVCRVVARRGATDSAARVIVSPPGNVARLGRR